mmetsp:Transcript_11382/g.10890  ORF Transcript_11382/g.10890 Transcript_11382/m.10890 type:complete len:238 (-) Transcript_11382:272-985(-)
MYATRSSSSLLRQKIQQRCIIVAKETHYRKALLHSSRTLCQAKKKSPDVAKKVISKKKVPAAAPPPSHQESELEFDPHAMAQKLILKSEGRMQGTEAIQSMTPEQRMRNYATAAGLVGFVTWVWWYSMQAVGRSQSNGDGDIEQKLRNEAEDAVNSAETKSISQQEAEELAQLDVTLSGDLDGDDGSIMGEDIIVAVAAPDDIATAEENINLAAVNKKGTNTGKPLWKKVVFFWRRD